MGEGLPIFAHGHADAAGPDRPVALPAMPMLGEVVADYQTGRLSLRAHPMRFFRRSLEAQGYTTARHLAGRNHPSVRVAGLVLIRQKPGSAKGVCFITLEDETGVVNVVVWRRVFARFRAPIMSARLLDVRGRVETDGRAIHVVAHHIRDRSDALGRLADEAMPATTGRGDHPTNPIAGQVDAMPGGDGSSGAGMREEVTAPGTRGHPRDARVIPKGRDFR